MDNYYDIKVRGVWVSFVINLLFEEPFFNNSKLECKRTVPRDSERFIRELEQELENGSKNRQSSSAVFEQQEDNYDNTKVSQKRI